MPLAYHVRFRLQWLASLILELHLEDGHETTWTTSIVTARAAAVIHKTEAMRVAVIRRTLPPTNSSRRRGMFIFNLTISIFIISKLRLMILFILISPSPSPEYFVFFCQINSICGSRNVGAYITFTNIISINSRSLYNTL